MSAPETAPNFIERLRAEAAARGASLPPEPPPPPAPQAAWLREAPRMSRISETLLARALFATDPRIVAIVASVEGPTATTVDLLRRAWMHEQGIREECLARAAAVFAIAGVG